MDMRKNYQKPDITIVSVNLPPLLTDSMIVGNPTIIVESSSEIQSRQTDHFFDGIDDGTAIPLIP